MKHALLLSAVLVLTPTLTSAQVTEWFLQKGALYDQTANNTQPSTASDWGVGMCVVTTDPGDASSVTISGGGIVGSMNLVQEDEVWVLDAFYPSQAALNAVFPSSTSYTFTLSGGALGTLTQTVPFGTEQYPNIPYLTGGSWDSMQSYNSAASNTATWNNPGPLTAASGFTLFEICDLFDNEYFAEETSGVATSALVPADTLFASQSYIGGILVTNDMPVSGTGGFGVGGFTGHAKLTNFPISTIDMAITSWRNSGANPNSYVAGPPALGKPWTGTVDLTTTGHSFAQILGYASPTAFALGGGQEVLVGGSKLLTLPLKPGPVATWNVLLPADTSLAGVTLYTQAAHVLGVKPFALSNAQDMTLGS